MERNTPVSAFSHEIAQLLAQVQRIFDIHRPALSTALKNSPSLRSRVIDTIAGFIDSDSIADITADATTDTADSVAAVHAFLDNDDEQAYDSSLFVEANNSVQFNLQEMDEAETLHQFLLTPRIDPPVSKLTFDYISARPPRLVEILPAVDQLKQLIYLPSLSTRFHEFLRKMPGEKLEEFALDALLKRRLSAGPSIANSSILMHTEADVEFHVRVTQADIVPFSINMVHERSAPQSDPLGLYSHKGTPALKPGRKSHAISDLQVGNGVFEVKTILSIDEAFIDKLLGFNPTQLAGMMHGENIGIVFEFDSPQSITDKLDSIVQSVVQLWVQLREKSFSFGEGTSQDFSYFVVKDPEFPNRLIISPCYSTFPASLNPTESGVYTTYNMFRIANHPDYSKQFLQELRAALQKPDALVNAVVPEIGELPPTVDLRKGTVGVKNIHNSKSGVLRVPDPEKTPPKYKEDSHSRIDESALEADRYEELSFDIPSSSDAAPPLQSTPLGPRRKLSTHKEFSGMTCPTKGPTASVSHPRSTRSRSRANAAPDAAAASAAPQHPKRAPTAKEAASKQATEKPVWR